MTVWWQFLSYKLKINLWKTPFYFFLISTKEKLLNYWITTPNNYLVWTQSMGFPTYCLVVTAMEKVTKSITVALLWSRKIKLSMVTRLTWKQFNQNKREVENNSTETKTLHSNIFLCNMNGTKAYLKIEIQPLFQQSGKHFGLYFLISNNKIYFILSRFYFIRYCHTELTSDYF